MPDPTPEEIARKLSTAANASFDQFGAALHASGVDANNDWSQVRLHQARLDTLSRQVASGISGLHEDTSMPDAERRARIVDINQTFDEMSRSIEKDLRGSVAKVEASLLESQRVLPDSDPQQRLMVRNEIDQLVSGYPPSTPEKPGKPMLVKLMEIAQQSPAYASEIADSYGKVKMTAAGETEFITNLYKNVIGLAGATSPKAQACKATQDQMAQLQVAGHIAGLYQAAKFRVQGANSPKPPVARPAWQPDTIRPIR
jgi:hypothetical protein